MLVPLSWLKDFVTFDKPVEQVDRLLTNAGLEVKTTRIGIIPLKSLQLNLDAQVASGQGFVIGGSEFQGQRVSAVAYYAHCTTACIDLRPIQLILEAVGSGHHIVYSEGLPNIRF